MMFSTILSEYYVVFCLFWFRSMFWVVLTIFAVRHGKTNDEIWINVYNGEKTQMNIFFKLFMAISSFFNIDEIDFRFELQTVFERIHTNWLTDDNKWAQWNYVGFKSNQRNQMNWADQINLIWKFDYLILIKFIAANSLLSSAAIQVQNS